MSGNYLAWYTFLLVYHQKAVRRLQRMINFWVVQANINNRNVKESSRRNLKGRRFFDCSNYMRLIPQLRNDTIYWEHETMKVAYWRTWLSDSTRISNTISSSTVCSSSWASWCPASGLRLPNHVKLTWGRLELLFNPNYEHAKYEHASHEMTRVHHTQWGKSR